MRKNNSKNFDAERVIKRISDLRHLSLQLANAGLNAELFKIDISKYTGPLPSEYEILNLANQSKRL